MSSDIIWRDGFDFISALTNGTGENEMLSRATNALGKAGATSAGGYIIFHADYSRWPEGKGLSRYHSTPSADPAYIEYTLASPLAQICLSGAVKRRVTPTTNGTGILFLYSASGIAIKIRFGVDGVVEVTNAAGTRIAASDSAAPLQQWQWLSVRIVCHGSTGSARIVMPGIEDKTVTGLNTDPLSDGAFTRFGYGSRNATGEFNAGTVTGGQYHMDDIHVSTDILSERRVATLYPASDVLSQWTPNAGANNYSRVNQVVSDADTTYVSADNQGTKDVYGFGALPAGVGDIDGVTLNIVARKEDAGDTRKVTGVIRVADVDSYFADEHALPTGYAFLPSVMPNPPSGGWTEAKLEKFGFDLTVGETSP